MEAVARQAVERLLAADPDIRAIVLFGSAAYAPELARDLDLLVLTSKKRDPEVYLQAVAVEEEPLPVDLVVREVGEREGLFPGPAGGRLLWGDEGLWEEVRRSLAWDREEVEARLRGAEKCLRLALEEGKPQDRDWWLRKAFDALFDAARMGVMIHLGTGQSRWGQLARELPPGQREEFRRLINTLHILYAYEGRYPQEGVEEHFAYWKGEVEGFLRSLGVL